MGTAITLPVANRAVWSRESSSSADGVVAGRSPRISPRAGKPPVIAAIRDLPELEQEIITMLIWDELAPREVAAVLGLTPNMATNTKGDGEGARVGSRSGRRPMPRPYRPHIFVLSQSCVYSMCHAVRR